ncbi:MAG TPA: hypothetical protein VGH74_04115, partial [Planctomycetaceae bacterium]
MTRKLQHVNRRLTDAERERHAQIRDAALQDIPAKSKPSRKASAPGIPTRVRTAREARGLT